ncbi:hypothetical protein OGAPHI_004624 [Ogataea philodendri]|uniref:Uncharacterized protein n=1 Tax=Ogataea philodendri TaxID=1378263 RepID=A0A9P8P3P2_9ASCO|nr:uncharacterized protein OGAPHI_004624 [Ogataea philodendri]KAH3664272.1 hypothetical protein OGAPHI_004624 [Ogataea philodendri]
MQEFVAKKLFVFSVLETFFDVAHHVRVPEECGPDGGEMPERVGVHQVEDRGKVEQLERHAGTDTEHQGERGEGPVDVFVEQVGFERRRAARFAETRHRMVDPEHVLEQAAKHICLHVVSVGPVGQESGHMAKVCQQSHQTKQLAFAVVLRQIQLENTHGNGMEARQNRGPGKEIVQPFAVPCVSKMEDGGEEPRTHGHQGHHEVRPVQLDERRVSCSDLLSALFPDQLGPPVMREPVPDAEKGTEQFLDPQNANKRPLAMELVHLLALADAVLGDDSLALGPNGHDEEQSSQHSLGNLTQNNKQRSGHHSQSHEPLDGVAEPLLDHLDDLVLACFPHHERHDDRREPAHLVFYGKLVHQDLDSFLDVHDVNEESKHRAAVLGDETHEIDGVQQRHCKMQYHAPQTDPAHELEVRYSSRHH